MVVSNLIYETFCKKNHQTVIPLKNNDRCKRRCYSSLVAYCTYMRHICKRMDDIKAAEAERALICVLNLGQHPKTTVLLYPTSPSL